MNEREKPEIFEVFTRREVHATTLWLHGLGVGAEDLNPLLVNLRQSRELGLHYLAPNAPIRRITVNRGAPARAWFDVRGEPGKVAEDREGIEHSTQTVHDILDHQRERGSAAERTIVAGFSQGGSIALHAALRYPVRLAGIIVLSGELLLRENLESERHPANRDTPVLMLHGRDDQTVPVEDARRDCERLQQLGQPVEWQEFDVGHSLLPEQVERVDEWMAQRLDAELAR